MGTIFQKKRLTTHTEREHGDFKNNIHCKHSQNEISSNKLEKPKLENVNNNNNNRTLLVGPSLSGKTYLMLKFLHNYPIEIFT